MKIINYLFSFLIILMIIFNFIYVLEYQLIIKEITYLWFTLLLPSIMPMYVLTNFLIRMPNFFKFLYKVFNPFYHFESETSASIFILSFFTGNPSITLMITDSISHQLLSYHEGNRLMRCSSHFSFIFIKLVTKEYFLIVFLALFLSSSIIFRFSKYENKKLNLVYNSSFSFFDVLNKIIDQGYLVLLKILYIMLIVGFFSNFINFIFHFKNISFFTAFFEVTTGINFFNHHLNNDFLRLLLITMLLSSNGLSVIIQTINAMKDQLNRKNYLVFRFIHMLLSSFLLIIFWNIK